MYGYKIPQRVKEFLEGQILLTEGVNDHFTANP